MRYVRLRRFLIISSVLHIVALFIAAAFFHPKGIITKPQLIKVGVISEYKDFGVGSGNSVESPPNEAPKLEKSVESHPKEAIKSEKKVVKGVTEKKQGIVETSEKKEIVDQVNESVDEKGTAEPGQNMEGEQTNEITSATVAGIESSTGTGFSKEEKGIDTEGSGQGGEQVGYPDYKINPKPNYPMIARRSGYEGVVLLRVFVLENGRVGKIELEKSSGYGMLDKSALNAVKDWVFIPGKRDGVSISSWVTVPIRFELNSG